MGGGSPCLNFEIRGINLRVLRSLPPCEIDLHLMLLQYITLTAFAQITPKKAIPRSVPEYHDLSSCCQDQPRKETPNDVYL
jgi:hypothetical protein